MSDGFGIRQSNIDNNYNTAATSNTDRAVGNHLANGTGGSNYIEPQKIEKETYDDATKKQEQQNRQALEKAIKDVIRGTDLTVEDVLKMLSVLASLNTERKELSPEQKTNILSNITKCLRFAIEDCKTENGKVDKDKLRNTFGCYVLLTSNKEKPMTCEQVQKMMKMSLVQMIKAQNPALKEKTEITAKDIADILKSVIHEKLKDKDKLNSMSKCPAEVKEYIRSLFGAGLEKCSPEEMKLLTEAFIILLKDNSLVDEVHTIVEQVCNKLKESPEELNKFINTTLVQILKKHNFTDDAINRIITSALSDFLAKNPDKLEILIQGGIDFLRSLADNPKDLEILLKVLDKHLNPEIDDLSDEELAVLNKYQGQISQLIQVYAQIANKPELAEKFQEKLKELNGLVEQTGIGNYIFNSLQNLFEQNPDLFENFNSKDDFIKKLNEITDNKYSEAIGDTNPENLYNDASNTQDNNIGMSQRVSYEQIALISNSVSQKQSDLLITTEDNEFSLIKDEPAVTDPNQSYNNFKNLTVDEIRTGLSRQKIKISDVLHQYKNLSQSGKDFIEGLIKTMPKNSQYYYLKCIPSNIAIVALIKHTKINPEGFDIESSLDYASRKEVERIQENNKAIK